MAMSVVVWLLEVCFAFAFLILEGLFQLVWLVQPFTWLQQLVTRALLPPAEVDPNWDRNVTELVKSKGYQVEEHYATTADGFILCLHRILPKTKDKHDRPVAFKGVAFFQHGFMQCSEGWVARGPDKDLTYMLVDQGYDVWLGNNRGTKYSFKHLCLQPSDEKFWDFCIDHYALYDLPAMINYVLAITGAETLSYVGFSQGTAQAFAAFSMNDQLASRVNVFVALAPAARSKGLKNPLVAAVTVSRPNLIYKLFGKKELLGQTMFWRRVLTRPIYVWIVDVMMDFLFGWKTRNIDPADKPLVYSHLYTYSSVKNLIHWFQITHTRRFQMFDDQLVTNDGRSGGYHAHVIPHYQLSRIKCPIAVFYGGADTVADSDYLMEVLPKGTTFHKEDSYEHLDFLWAKTVATNVYSKAVEVVNKHSCTRRAAPTAAFALKLPSSPLPAPATPTRRGSKGRNALAEEGPGNTPDAPVVETL
jgi:lysosomal acid lipase/cholesteryl ester hydrolase